MHTAQPFRARASYTTSATSAQVALSWLERDTNLALLTQQARSQGALLQDCLAVLASAGLPMARTAQQQARYVLQISLRGAILTCRVGSAALANKIRHLSPSLCADLRHKGWQVNSIRVQVQPQLQAPYATPKTANLSPHGLKTWEAVLPKLHEPTLYAAVEKLLRRHKNI